MPDLDFAILCEAARVADNLLFIHSAGWDTLSGPIGIAYPVTVALRLLLTRAECGRLHKLEILVHGEDGELLTKTDLGITAAAPASDVPAGWPIPVMASIRFPVLFRRYGLYSIEILFGNSSLKSLPLRFASVPPSPHFDPPSV